MFWDSTRWVDESAVRPSTPPPRRRRRIGTILVSAFVLVGMVGTAAPGAHVAAATLPAAQTGMSTWSESHAVRLYQETSPRMAWRGTWVRGKHAQHLGDGAARTAKARGAKMSIKVTGTGVMWIGTVGPTRGKARVYIDGRLVKTVDTYSPRWRTGRVLFKATWSAERTRRLTVVVQGTKGRPAVTVDAVLVRGKRLGQIDQKSATAPQLSPTPTPTATATPSTGGSVRVTTISGLLTSLADNTITDIVVANGTYRVSPASSQASNSLWIGSKFAGRTASVTVRAETRGGVTFDGGGATYFGGLTFVDGAHHQTWDGFRFANGKPTETGVIVFGGYGRPSPHHITLRHITMLPSIVGSTLQNDHLIYFSKDAAHDILIEDYTATPGASIQSALQFYHSPNAYNLVVRRMHVTGTQNAIVIYDGSVHDVLIEDSDIRDARDVALNVAATGANVVLRNVTSNKGSYYPNGKPAGLSLVNCSFQ